VDPAISRRGGRFNPGLCDALTEKISMVIPGSVVVVDPESAVVWLAVQRSWLGRTRLCRGSSETCRIYVGHAGPPRQVPQLVLGGARLRPAALPDLHSPIREASGGQRPPNYTLYRIARGARRRVAVRGRAARSAPFSGGAFRAIGDMLFVSTRRSVVATLFQGWCLLLAVSIGSRACSRCATGWSCSR